jgi:hypothetical protein
VVYERLERLTVSSMKLRGLGGGIGVAERSDHCIPGVLHFVQGGAYRAALLFSYVAWGLR